MIQLIASFIIVIIITIAIHIESIETFCPPRCRCNDLKLSVYCNGTQIDLVPIMLNPLLKELYLGNSRVKNVQAISVYQELRYLDLSHNGLSTNGIGSRSFMMQKKLRVLLLNGNNVSVLTNQSFHGLNTLQLLNLRQNQLRELHSRIFMGLNRLESLDLSYNQLTFINNEAFFGLLNLKQLNLQTNKLKQVPSSAFFHLQSLTKLNLGTNLISGTLNDLTFAPLNWLQELRLDSNHINHVTAKAFQLSNLNYLDLQSNKLNTVPTESFQHLSNLQILILSRNHFIHIGSNAFAGLVQLRGLVISNTPLNHINIDAFRSNPQLEKLILEHNRQLGRLDSSTLPNSIRYLSLRSNRLSTFELPSINLDQMEYIDLQDNPLVCNCTIAWFANYLQQTNQTIREQVKCYRPSQHYNRPLISLSRDELSCPIDFDLPTLWASMLINLASWLAISFLIILLLVVLPIILWRRRRRQQQLRTLENHYETTVDIIGDAYKSRLDPLINHNQMRNHHQHHPHHHPHYSPHQYYPTIINEEYLSRDKRDYQTMMTTSTRTSALSVDCHPPPLPYAPIANM
ncbi:hypothetical protein RDWZM_001069 [Blomia tropicalis]|uniref:LRRCT domain-containing protein n=1 Tax=Blomia tropicalis TaxID=40697 RepID=A0A9Q0MBD7_BLOTA|nr:hypothetical protein RDWZM_001069 [Blomia tropicalis]